jgi:Glycosyltransferase family 29 (sialyltransferase)
MTPTNKHLDQSTEVRLSKISGSIAVVGNGALLRPFGHLIDAHDEVIRFNAFRLNGYEDYCGSRTTHWCTFGETAHNLLPRRHLLELEPLSPFTEDAPESQGIRRTFRARMTFAQRDYRLACFGRPSTGVMLLRMLEVLGFEADVFGFDGFLTGHYFDMEHIHDPDHLGTEFLYLATRDCFHVYMEDMIPCPRLREDLPTLLKRVRRQWHL